MLVMCPIISRGVTPSSSLNLFTLRSFSKITPPNIGKLVALYIKRNSIPLTKYIFNERINIKQPIFCMLYLLMDESMKRVYNIYGNMICNIDQKYKSTAIVYENGDYHIVLFKSHIPSIKSDYDYFFDIYEDIPYYFVDNEVRYAHLTKV